MYSQAGFYMIMFLLWLTVRAGWLTHDAISRLENCNDCSYYERGHRKVMDFFGFVKLNQQYGSIVKLAIGRER